MASTGRTPARQLVPPGPRPARIGLLGGSFDPPHSGHVRITLRALKALDLDQLWWLVSGANPLKHRLLPPAAARIGAARRLLHHPRVRFSDFEARSGLNRTADTLQALQAGYPGVNFIWLMGSDNLAQLHRWHRWHDIMERVPVGVFARPTDRFAATSSVAARRYSGFRIGDHAVRGLADCTPPAWGMIRLPLDSTSSTGLRNCLAEHSGLADRPAPVRPAGEGTGA